MCNCVSILYVCMGISRFIGDNNKLHLMVHTIYLAGKTNLFLQDWLTTTLTDITAIDYWLKQRCLLWICVGWDCAVSWLEREEFVFTFCWCKWVGGSRYHQASHGYS